MARDRKDAARAVVRTGSHSGQPGRRGESARLCCAPPFIPGAQGGTGSGLRAPRPRSLGEGRMRLESRARSPSASEEPSPYLRDWREEQQGNQQTGASTVTCIRVPARALDAPRRHRRAARNTVCRRRRCLMLCCARSRRTYACGRTPGGARRHIHQFTGVNLKSQNNHTRGARGGWDSFKGWRP